MQQYIGFKLNGSEYTIPILKVREIINTPSITRLPQSPHYMRGIINLRGKIIPVVDLRKLISVGETGLNGSTKVIVVSSGKIAFGILVDSITSVVNINESDIEPPEGFMQEHIEQVEGVAKLDDRLVVLLDTNKLVEVNDLELFEESFVDVKETGEAGKVEVTRMVETMGGDIMVKELADAKDMLSKKYGDDDPRHRFIEDMVKLIDTLAAHDLEKADLVITELLQSPEGALYREIGRVTRKLHNSITEFKVALDPRLKRLAREEMPNAVDSLQFVIEKTEDAANRTMGIVEKYIAGIGELSKHIEKLKGPKQSVGYLKSFSQSLSSDLTEILIAQEYQDITGQTIRKVIDLVNAMEVELVKLIATFGVKLDASPVEEKEIEEKVTQNDVDDLLKGFGF
jgi:chemotaxis signal transduction protein/chemotaxis regulatin CheY-phosphate phosphatase CheZ